MVGRHHHFGLHAPRGGGQADHHPAPSNPLPPPPCQIDLPIACHVPPSTPSSDARALRALPLPFTAGAVSLAQSLPSALRLHTLLLPDNRIEDEGFQALLTALQHHDTLTHLSLCSNAVGDLGAGALAAVLSGPCTLQRVDLSHNHIGTEGASALGAALRKRRGKAVALALHSNPFVNFKHYVALKDWKALGRLRPQKSALCLPPASPRL